MPPNSLYEIYNRFLTESRVMKSLSRMPTPQNEQPLLLLAATTGWLQLKVAPLPLPMTVHTLNAILNVTAVKDDDTGK